MTQERSVRPLPGYASFAVHLLLLGGAVTLLVLAIRSAQGLGPLTGGLPAALDIVIAALCVLAVLASMFGFFIVEPNTARVLVLFGKYKGTVLENGFFWTNPFMSKRRVSLRARNLNGERLKVNDKAGNPIEIAAVVVWRVRDTVRALFEVDDYLSFVITQSEAAVRHLAGTYPYDAHVEGEGAQVVSLRDGQDQVAIVLERELGERLARAGIEVLEARLSHLAYAPEIAGAMLQRQQADAVVAARTRIVDGAVGMVKLALDRLKEDAVIELDSERKAAMVSNLLVVLCAHDSAQPVVNAGTLYT